MVGEEDVGAEEVFERQAGAGAVLGAQNDEARRSGALRAERHDDLFVEVGKTHAAPAQAAAGPGGDAVEVRGLLNARQLRELGAGIGRWGGCEGGGSPSLNSRPLRQNSHPQRRARSTGDTAEPRPRSAAVMEAGHHDQV